MGGETMPRAVLKNGVICPVDRLPAEWQEGQELWVDTCELVNGDGLDEGGPEAIDEWYEKLNEMVSQNDPEDLRKVEEILEENDRIEKDRMRKVMGLS
jgi:hypothetical protein